MTKIQNPKRALARRQRFGHSGFEFWICFGFRTSDFAFLIMSYDDPT
jgi:hypothetical protein